MSPELIVALGSLVLNALVVPAVVAQVRLNWNHERRITRCETQLGIARELEHRTG
jgi:hypothetical protein